VIERPRRMSFDWHGTEGREPVAGDFMRAVPRRGAGRLYLVLTARRVRVKVTRGETLRQSIEMVVWPDALPAGARVHRFHWNARKPKRGHR